MYMVLVGGACIYIMTWDYSPFRDALPGFVGLVLLLLDMKGVSSAVRNISAVRLFGFIVTVAILLLFASGPLFWFLFGNPFMFYFHVVEWSVLLILTEAFLLDKLLHRPVQRAMP